MEAEAGGCFFVFSCWTDSSNKLARRVSMEVEAGCEVVRHWAADVNGISLQLHIRATLPIAYNHFNNNNYNQAFYL